jgi:integrase
VLDNYGTLTPGSKQPWGFIYLEEADMNLQIDEYLASRHDFLPTARDTARKHLGWWDKWLDDRDLEDVTISEFEAWVVEKGWGNSMHYNSLGTIKGYLKWTGKDHPLLAHKVRRQVAPPGPYVTEQDVMLMLGQCNMLEPTRGRNFAGVSARGIRDYAVVAFLWSTWCRAQELCDVQLKHLNIKLQNVMFRVKGGALEVAAIDLDLKDALEVWLMVRKEIARPTSKALFVSTVTGKDLTYDSLLRLLRRLGKQVGLSVTPHMFRRGASTNFAQNGGNDRVGMKRGRWRSHRMYELYTRSVSLESVKSERWMGGRGANDPSGGLQPPGG